MIIQLKDQITAEESAKIANEIQAFHIVYQNKNLLITGSGVKEVPPIIENKVDQFWVFANDMQLASKKYLPTKREVKIGPNSAKRCIRFNFSIDVQHLSKCSSVYYNKDEKKTIFH